MSEPKYVIRKYNESLKDDWYNVINNSDGCWIFHDKEICEVYAKRFKAIDESFLVYNKAEKPVAIIPLYSYRIRKCGKFLCSFDMSGPAFVNSVGNTKQFREIIRVVDAELSRMFKQERADSMKIAFPNLARSAWVGEKIINPLSELRSLNTIVVAYYYMDLSKSEDELRAGLEVRCRNAINRFERNYLDKFEFRRADVNDIDLIWKLYCKTMERTQLPFHPKEELEFYLKYKYCNFYLALYKSDGNLVPTCAINIGEYKDTGVYWLSYSDDDYIKTDIATYLLWYAILETKRHGIIHLDCGNESFCEIGSKNDRISVFKRGFGGELRYKYFMTRESVNGVFVRATKEFIKSIIRRG